MGEVCHIHARNSGGPRYLASPADGPRESSRHLAALVTVDGELVEVGYFDPASPPELAFPTDALVLAQLAEERPIAEDDPAK